MVIYSGHINYIDLKYYVFTIAYCRMYITNFLICFVSLFSQTTELFQLYYSCTAQSLFYNNRNN